VVNFNVAAEAYDRYMGRWSSQLAPSFIEFAGMRAGSTVLDVGCGPGALTAGLAALFGPAFVKAVDPSPQFVAAARDRHPGVEVQQAAAAALPFPDAVFDAALAQLVVHFMDDPIVGLVEMGRVTRDGGVISACVWDYAGGRGPLGPFWDVARELDAAVVDESHLPGAREGHLARLFEVAGLLDIHDTELSVTREYESFEDWWVPFTLGVGPGGAYVAGLAPDHVTGLRDGCRDRLGEGPFMLRAEAWSVRGAVRHSR
jgi:SAM-dependent methyltransferase